MLPAVLLGLMGLGMVATGLIALTRSEVLSGRSAFRYAGSIERARGLLGAGGPERLTTRELPHGFELVGASPDSGGLTHFAVRWVMDPELVAAALPGAAEASTVRGDVEVAADCVRSHDRPLTLGRGPDAPRLGVLDVEALRGLVTDVVLAEFPDRPGPGVFEATGATIVAGSATGILVAGSDLTLGGTSDFEGLIVSAGSVVLQEGARVEGVVLAGEVLEIFGDAVLIGCLDRAVTALGHPGLGGAHPLPSGGFLGRY